MYSSYNLEVIGYRRPLHDSIQLQDVYSSTVAFECDVIAPANFCQLRVERVSYCFLCHQCHSSLTQVLQSAATKTV
jgi:hypothetical protein